jgi:hypothetical protein
MTENKTGFPGGGKCGLFFDGKTENCDCGADRRAPEGLPRGDEVHVTVFIVVDMTDRIQDLFVRTMIRIAKTCESVLA